MKFLILGLALTFAVTTSALACPEGYYPCGAGGALCCPG